MTTIFPGGLDSFINPTATNTLNNPSHSGQHDNINDAMLAVQAKVGVNQSSVTTSLDYLVSHLNPASLIGVVSVPNGGTGLSSVLSHALLTGQATSVFGQIATGQSGQVLTSNGSLADPSFQNPNQGQVLTTFTAGQSMIPGQAVMPLPYYPPQIGFDKSSSSIFASSSVASNTFVVANNQNRMLVVAISGVTTADIASITYAGVALTKSANVLHGSSFHLDIWTLQNPATGSNSLNFYATANVGGTGMLWNSYSYYNMAQQSPEATGSVTGSSNTGSSSILTLTNGSLVFIAGALGTGINGSAVVENSVQNILPSQGYGLMSADSGSVFPQSIESATISSSGGGDTNPGLLMVSFAPAIITSSIASRLYLTNSNLSVTTQGYIGINQSSVATGSIMTVALNGLDSNQVGLTTGVPYYISSISGGISSVAGTNSRIAGIAASPTSIVITNAG